MLIVYLSCFIFICSRFQRGAGPREAPALLRDRDIRSALRPTKCQPAAGRSGCAPAHQGTACFLTFLCPHHLLGAGGMLGTAADVTWALSWMFCPSLGSRRPHTSHPPPCQRGCAVPLPLQGQTGVLHCPVWAVPGRNHPAPQSAPGPL